MARSHLAAHRRPMRISRVGRTAVLAALALSLAGNTASALLTPSQAFAAGLPAHAADGSGQSSRVTFGVAPVTAPGTSGRSSFSYGVSPGGSLTDKVAVLNYSRQPLTLQVYPADATPTQDGTFAVKLRQQRATDAGSWIRLGSPAPTVRVPARGASGPGAVLVPMQVTVPLNASPGDHVAGIVASLQSEGTNGSTKVKLDQRVGTRVYIRVAGDLAPALTLSNVSASYHGTLNPVGRGSVDVTYTISNTGNVNLGAVPSVKAAGFIGGAVSTGSLQAIPLLIPGASTTLTTRLSGVAPLGPVHVSVAVKPVGLAGDSDPALPVVTATTSVWAISWTLVALVVLIVGLVIYTVLRRRNRPAKRGGSRARRTGGKGTRRAKDARRAGQNAPEEVGV